MHAYVMGLFLLLDAPTCSLTKTKADYLGKAKEKTKLVLGYSARGMQNQRLGWYQYQEFKVHEYHPHD
jgi:hypothetical protein